MLTSSQHRPAKTRRKSRQHASLLTTNPVGKEWSKKRSKHLSKDQAACKPRCCSLTKKQPCQLDNHGRCHSNTISGVEHLEVGANDNTELSQDLGLERGGHVTGSLHAWGTGGQRKRQKESVIGYLLQWSSSLGFLTKPGNNDSSFI